jgi:hypothetical protein
VVQLKAGKADLERSPGDFAATRLVDALGDTVACRGQSAGRARAPGPKELLGATLDAAAATRMIGG